MGKHSIHLWGLWGNGERIGVRLFGVISPSETRWLPGNNIPRGISHRPCEQGGKCSTHTRDRLFELQETLLQCHDFVLKTWIFLIIASLKCNSLIQGAWMPCIIKRFCLFRPWIDHSPLARRANYPQIRFYNSRVWVIRQLYSLYLKLTWILNNTQKIFVLCHIITTNFKVFWWDLRDNHHFINLLFNCANTTEIIDLLCKGSLKAT